MRWMIGLACLAVIVATPARADRIDGTWCGPGGAHMMIDGSRVVTPAGNHTTGRYTRHRFDYEIPAGERHAGGRIWADQINDRTIRVTLIKIDQREPGAHDTWERCEITS